MEVFGSSCQFLCSPIGRSKRAISDRRSNGAFLRSRKSAFSIQLFRSSNPIRTSRRKTVQRGARFRLLDRKVFEAHRISHYPTKHTITPYNSSDAGLTATMLLLLLLLLLLTATQRGTSCSPPASNAYRHPMAAVRVIDDLYATPLLLLLLCSLWRLSTKPNATTATMKLMRASRAPNERFAGGKGATKTCD